MGLLGSFKGLFGKSTNYSRSEVQIPAPTSQYGPSTEIEKSSKRSGKTSRVFASLRRPLRWKRSPNKFVSVSNPEHVSAQLDTNGASCSLPSLDFEQHPGNGWDLDEILSSYTLSSEQEVSNSTVLTTFDAADSTNISSAALSIASFKSSVTPQHDYTLYEHATTPIGVAPPVDNRASIHKIKKHWLSIIMGDTAEDQAAEKNTSDKDEEVDQDNLESGVSATNEANEAHGDEDEEAETTNGNNKSQTRLDRHDWDSIHEISALEFKLLLHSSVADHPDSNDLSLDECHVISRFDGGFNHIVSMATIQDRGKHVERYIVRVPAIGTAARWQEGDAHNMRCEVALMKYLRQNTKIPVPEIVASEDDLHSHIGAPYILMKRLPGSPAHHRWFDEPKNPNYINANRVSPEMELVRRNILTSLAGVMAELQDLEFDKIGMPDFTKTVENMGDAPVIMHSYRWKDPDKMTPEDLESESQVYAYGPFDSSKEYMTSKLEEKWSSTPDPEDDDNPYVQNMCLGVRKILDIIYAVPAITCSSETNEAKETFVLRHPDLDLQNILTDDDGNVTGILDWESCLALPRCVGYASLPEFLRRDWTSSFSVDDSPHMSWQLDHYRQIYADAMLATGCPDARYTRKSAIYRAVADAVNALDNQTCSEPDLISKLLMHIPGLRTCDVDEFEMCLGKGWSEAEEFLEVEIGKLLDPAVPMA